MTGNVTRLLLVVVTAFTLAVGALGMTGGLVRAFVPDRLSHVAPARSARSGRSAQEKTWQIRTTGRLC